MLAIIFALCSMLFAAVNDFLFKLYAQTRSAIGLYMAIVGVVWTVVFAVILAVKGGGVFSGEALKWGLLSGLFSALANIMLIEVMSVREVGVCSTIYRLNLAPAAILAFIFLGEPVTVYKILGIVSAVVAVMLFSGMGFGNLLTKFDVLHWVVAAAAILRALMGISYKYGLSEGAGAYEILTLNGLVWVVVGLLYTALLEKRVFAISNQCMSYGFVSGGLVCGIVLFMMLALKHGQASIVLPIAQLSFLITSVIGMIFLNEKLSLTKFSALLLALCCIIFMSVN